jgi:hypothetical protein
LTWIVYPLSTDMWMTPISSVDACLLGSWRAKSNRPALPLPLEFSDPAPLACCPR